jgi:hypothetical protein
MNPNNPDIIEINPNRLLKLKFPKKTIIIANAIQEKLKRAGKRADEICPPEGTAGG